MDLLFEKKDEVFGRFKEFKALVENLTWKKIKVLRLDNGGEYVDKDFTDFCAKASKGSGQLSTI